MPHQFNPAHLGHLDNPVRRLSLPPLKVLRRIGVVPGDVVIDFGAGSGYLALPAAGMVGAAGRVLALDIAPEALALIEGKRATTGIDNLRTALAIGDGLGMPAGEATLAFLFTVFHEVEDRVGTLRALHAALKPGGRLVIVEFGPEALFGPPRSERIAEGDLLAALSGAGFATPSFERLNASLYIARGIKGA